ncbi:glycosyltransferase family 39 protein [Candidatus Saccharibacteria bacterium]|nr:glycosyltransferase family 39 protein [Candidatus Saccharibacteria bacterium]MBQ6130450.1 glycosyltransferase family 39 protein [Candidatus Saccharibacteria bacterium]
MKKQELNFFQKHRGKLLTLLFFLILFCFGLHFIPRVNGNFDENTEQNILLSNIKDYAEAFHIDEVASAIHDKQILAISVDPNRDHGIAPYYLFTPILILKGKYPHITSVLWHFYTYCLAFLGVIFFYLLTRYLFKNKKLSLLLTALYYLTPRMFVDSLHNNKDIVFMALLVAMIYFGIRFIKERRFSWALLFAFFGGFVCNIKILGLFFVGVIGLGYIIHLTIQKAWTKRHFLCGFTAAVAVFGWYLFLTPAIWGNGFALVEYIQYCLGNAVNFDVNTAVVFEGVIHRHSENPLPWYYIPKLIVVTLPMLLSILFVASSVLIVVDLVKSLRMKKLEFNNFVFLLVLTMFIVPFLFAILSNPNLYNGWRHFYFLYSLMLIIGSYAVFRLKEYKLPHPKQVSLGLIFLISLTLFGDIFCIFKYSMANTAYYNLLLGTKNLAGVYELDYYNVSSQEALKKFIASGQLEENEDKLLYLYGSGFGEVVLSDMKTYINSSLSQRIVLVTDDTYEKYFKQGKIIYNMSNPVYRYNDVSTYELVYSYKMFNSEVINFYRMS